MIKPIVGRVVWYQAVRDHAILSCDDAPLAAIIAGVIDDSHVNLVVFDYLGRAQHRSDVLLVQDGEALPRGPYAEWMPFQKGQAAKTEALEAEVKGGKKTRKLEAPLPDPPIGD